MKHKKFDNEVVNTVIGGESSIKGELHSQRSLRIEGSVEGEIRCEGEVYIGEDSQVKANVFGHKVTVAGEVIGNIETIKGLQIASTGKVYGNISGDQLIIEEGGIYKGQVNMDIISAQNPYEGNIELQTT